MILLAALLFARAGDGVDDGLDEHTVGTPAPQVAVAEAQPAPTVATHAVSTEAAALALGSDVERIGATRAAIDLLYARRYPDARRAFDALTTRYPTSGIGPVGVALIYQALMFENFDFRYEAQYRVASDQARAQLARGAKEPGNEALEAFLSAGLGGVDAIFAVRKGDYLVALDRALVAMRQLERTKELAPTFTDALLGDGMYLYWRTVVTQASPLLPDFPDKRAEGLAFMRRAEAESVFLGPAATLTLAYAHLEERQLANARDRCLAIRASYGDNVINNMTLGRVYTSMRRHDDALQVYGDVLGDAPDNQRVHYFRGLVLARDGRLVDSVDAYRRYLGFVEVPTDLRAQAWYRLGTSYELLGDRARARDAYERAVRSGGNEAARKALAALKKGDG